MFITNVLLKKAKSKHILVCMESVVSGHQFLTARERLADKLEVIQFDPYICYQYTLPTMETDIKKKENNYIKDIKNRMNCHDCVQQISLYKEKHKMKSLSTHFQMKPQIQKILGLDEETLIKNAEAYNQKKAMESKK